MKVYIYIYIIYRGEWSVRDRESEGIVRGRGWRYSNSFLQGTTTKQNVDNSGANKLAKKGADKIISHLKSEQDAGKSAGASGKEYLSSESQEKMFHTSSNLIEGIGYQAKQRRIRGEVGTGVGDNVTGDNVTTTEENAETESESESTVVSEEYSGNREMKKMVDDVGALALESSQVGKLVSISTNTFAWKGAKVKTKLLAARNFQSSSSTVSTPPGGIADSLGDSTNSTNSNTKFQFTEWDNSPLNGHPEAYKTISKTIDFSLYADGSTSPLNISQTKFPFYFFLRVTEPADEHFCAYYNEQTEKYSNKGMRIVYKRLVDGKGTIICSSNHLSEFGVLKNAPAEQMDVLSKTQYDVLTKLGSFSNYNILTSISNIYIYIYYLVFWFATILTILFVLYLAFTVIRDINYKKKTEPKIDIVANNEEIYVQCPKKSTMVDSIASGSAAMNTSEISNKNNNSKEILYVQPIIVKRKGEGIGEEEAKAKEEEDMPNDSEGIS